MSIHKFLYVIAPTFDELPPVTVEEYDALRENIPVVKIHYYIVKSSIQLQFDNQQLALSRQHNQPENKVTT